MDGVGFVLVPLACSSGREDFWLVDSWDPSAESRLASS